MSYRDKEKRKAWDKAYRLANADRLRAYMKPYLKAYEKTRKPRDRRAYQKAYRDSRKSENKAYRQEYDKAYRFANADKLKVFYRKHRALKRGVQHKAYATNYIFERDGWMCQLCGQKINKRLKYPHPRSKSIDHIIPLSKGGNDSPVNVQATHLRCNVGKHAINKGQLRLFG